ncbi:probable jasmonic acid carboxyl methyltransferase 1 [Trifolium pratense]|uniref:probable jasmonic acid carboxyl methyltransferase 1 n=1 Tax=Trifolium pratense TaxID=57577 RepID=UPI001E6949C9|nr:probable jasmonic acid carboxyl methyltransferase 1 [Trifolium pratense]
MATEQVLHMKGGVGETSYANNSLLQKKVILQVKTLLEENMISMVSKKMNIYCLRIADLGCSSGPNALTVISNIMNIIHKISLDLNHAITPAFQFYLNDLYGNDFNTIFKLLPDFYRQKRRDNVGECFISGTPGSFYGRLFPNNHIDFFHSSYSVHWLSQAPKDLAKNAEPLNKGDIYFSKTSPPSVYEAYYKQFEKDFKYFLKSRFEELTLDGMMVLTFLGRETSNFNTAQGVIGMVLKEMVKEGLVEEEKLDLFDFPVYYPTVEEVRQLIEEEGSFTLQTLKTFKIGWDANLQEDIVDYVVDSKMRGEFIAKYIRAVYEPLLIAEFGENVMDELFSRYAKMISELIEIENLEFTNIVLFVTKNS